VEQPKFGARDKNSPGSGAKRWIPEPAPCRASSSSVAQVSLEIPVPLAKLKTFAQNGAFIPPASRRCAGRGNKWPRTRRGSINARAETVADHPMFAGAFRERRGIVPVTVYYQRRTTGGSGHSFAISHKDGRPMGVRRPVGGFQMAERRCHPELPASYRRKPTRWWPRSISITEYRSCWRRKTGLSGSEDSQAICWRSCMHRWRTCCTVSSSEGRGGEPIIDEDAGR